MFGRRWSPVLTTYEFVIRGLMGTMTTGTASKIPSFPVPIGAESPKTGNRVSSRETWPHYATGTRRYDGHGFDQS